MKKRATSEGRFAVRVFEDPVTFTKEILFAGNNVKGTQSKHDDTLINP